jgi:diguanylate cyclase (GGDEF)-like protein
VLKTLVENNIGAVPVLREGKAVGIITEKDILKLASADIPLTHAVGEYMTRNVVCCSTDTSLVDIVKLMNTRQIRRVVITNGDGQAMNIVTVRDVFRNVEGDYGKFLERKLKNVKDVLNLLPEMLIEVTDLGSEQLIIWANEGVINRFGADIIDKPVTELIPHKSWEKISTTLKSGGRIEDVKIQTEHGIFELSGYFLNTDSNIEKGRCQLIIRDITEDVKLTVTDTLTSVYNRRFINEFLMKEIERSKRLKRAFSVVICDIDDFKDINDTHGHLPGDDVIKLFAGTIADKLRKVDVIGRYGGDEFIIIMPETPNKIATHVINRLRQHIADMEVEVPGQTFIHITASFGIASFPRDGTSSEGLLVTADERMYNAKRNGKNSISHQ